MVEWSEGLQTQPHCSCHSHRTWSLELSDNSCCTPTTTQLSLRSSLLRCSILSSSVSRPLCWCGWATLAGVVEVTFLLVGHFSPILFVVPLFLSRCLFVAASQPLTYLPQCFLSAATPHISSQCCHSPHIFLSAPVVQELSLSVSGALTLS